MIQHLLEPSHFPRLRALAFKCATAPSLLQISRHPPCRDLFKQLDAFFVSVQPLSRDFIIGNQSLLQKTLLHIGTSTDDDTIEVGLECYHLHYHGSHFLPFARLINATADCNLRSLYLSRRMQAGIAKRPSSNKSGIASLLSVCHERKIEVIFEEQIALHPLDPDISSEFWTRQRKLRGSDST